MKKLVFLIALISLSINLSAQKEEEGKIIREIISLEVERPKPANVNPDVPDTLPPTMAAPEAEVLKRAENWYKLKHIKYEKSSGATAGKTIACKATFIFKQKVLNPENDVDGKIIMDVIVEAKEGKYRYTIKNITHKANKPGMDCGDVYGKIPACGSMKVNDLTWKHVKSAAFASAKVLTDDLKAVMKKSSDEEKDEW
jgi:hypothetical protein